MVKKKAFAIQKFINPKNHPSTGNICVYHGVNHYNTDKIISCVSLSDCSHSITLHPIPKDSPTQWIAKLKIIRAVLDKFIIHLETLHKDSQGEWYE